MPKLKYIKPVAIFLILISFVSAIYLGYYRIKSEQANKNVSILVDYDEILALSQANGISPNEVLQSFAKAGASGVLLRERTVKDLAQSGEILVATANNLRLLRDGNPATYPGLNIRDGFTYLIFKNQQDYDYVAAQLDAKRNTLIRYANGSRYVLGTYLTEKGLEKLGVGFPSKEVAEIQKSSLELVVRIREWGNATPQSLEVLKQTLRALPHLSLITFNDEAIPALNNLPGLAKEIKDLGIPIGTYEFFNQQGLSNLAYLVDKNVIRAHAISENDMARLSPPEALDRYQLAVSERDMRVLYVRLYGMNNPDTALDKSYDFIHQVKAGVEKEGFQVGQATTFASLPYSGLLILLLGLGAIGAGLLLVLPYLNSRWLMALGLIGLIGWVGMFFVSPILARKAFALLTVILFPLVGILGTLREEPRTLPQSVLQLLKISAISLIGAIIMTGLLADKAFMLKLDSFAGVKMAHVAPIVLLAVFIFLQLNQPWGQLKKLALSPVLWLQALLGLFVLAALAVYVIRTGNEGTILVSSWENTFRGVLDRVMGVRPRTKEFLLGHPLMLLVLYYGFDLKKAVLLLFGLIGQISLINTYAHIHTPLLISLTRSFHGLWLGILCGALLIVVLNYALKWWKGRMQSE